MDEGALLAEVLDDVASVVGTEATLVDRLPEGVNGGAVRVQLGGTEMRCSKQCLGPNTPTTWTRRCAPRESPSTCVGTAIPPPPGSEWGPQPRMSGI